MTRNDVAFNTTADLSTRVSLAERVREALRGEIESGRWISELPSERHLSEEFRVSRPILHVALHALQKEGIIQIRPGQPSRVVQDPSKSAGAGKREKEVVFLYNARIKPDLTSVATLTGMLQQKLHRLGYGLRLVDAVPPGTRGLDKSLSRIDAEYRPSFYVSASVPSGVQQWMARCGVPSLILGFPTPGIDLPAIDVDQEATMRHAVQFLVRYGHRRIGLLNLPPTTVGLVCITEMFRRTCATLRSRGVTGRIDTSAARPALVESVVRRIFTQPNPPTAIIVTDLDLAIGLYTTLGQLGLQIPRKVSVISTGYWPLLDFLRPLPTCYRFAWENFAHRIVRIVDEYLRMGRWPRKFWKLLPTLREGRSVAALLKT